MKSDQHLESSIGKKKKQQPTLKPKKVKQLYSLFPLQIIAVKY